VTNCLYNCVAISFKVWLENLEKTFDGGAKKVWHRYGHYCGPGPALDRTTCDRLASGEPLPTPQDGIDAQCQIHDIEYCKCGADWKAGLWGSGAKSPCTQQSDITLINNLDKVKSQTAKQAIVKAMIKGYFGIHTAATRKQNAAQSRNAANGLHQQGGPENIGSPSMA
jgi:hypothetical protein